MNDPVDRVLVERERMDRGFPGGLLLSIAAHLLLVGAAIAAPLIRPKEPPLRVAAGMAVPMPPGGGGSPTAEEPAPAQPQAAALAPRAPEPKPEPPPKLLKPPTKPEPPKKKGLPDPTEKPRKAKARPPEKEAPPATAYDPLRDRAERRTPVSGPGGSGTGAQTPGLEFGPPGPGVPGGTDWLGDWYLAGVQRKIWVLWNQQVKSGFAQPIAVRFTILADGGVSDFEVVQSSGATLLDLAARRAVESAAPFGPLPKSYATNRYTVQAVFKPTAP